MTYEATRARVETYFDRTATRTWERLTSDAPVSKIRQTVREGRDQMRDRLLSALPQDLTGRRILDAGCGTGQLTEVLAARGAEVVAIDISPALINIARARLPAPLQAKVDFHAGDMLHEPSGPFDHVFAMDSLIYYDADHIRRAVDRFVDHGAAVRFTIAPRTPLLAAMWYAGKVFPKSDRSPTMVPHNTATLKRKLDGAGKVRDLGRVNCGFYISHALEVAS
ncbi:magnesium protoporphyrin IX methyltransferase [Ruegeria profundi]|uniref:magnesium protoporphyrin IX methyltransferase n=1 Tax=Ruegeria profundi TaxID=1685378 RepID=UPI001CD3EE51|nr:magnesium protoporphyrin IX methyltransferase [Ruegeria profundi]MCA0928517.1 magnesium protoporphyrin IX methyltransferase [Ruegeria profundi]